MVSLIFPQLEILLMLYYVHSVENNICDLIQTLYENHNRFQHQLFEHNTVEWKLYISFLFCLVTIRYVNGTPIGTYNIILTCHLHTEATGNINNNIEVDHGIKRDIISI